MKDFLIILDERISHRVYIKHEYPQGKPDVHRLNPEYFDENWYVITDGLYHFIKENLFLMKEELDCGTIHLEVYYPE